MNYEELVKALRIHASVDIECYECAYYDDCCINGNGHTKMMTDAAAAIDALIGTVGDLQAIRERLEEENDALRLEPKRGEWIWDDKRCIYVCSVCGSPKVRENMDRQTIKEQAYCYSCGAKMMEVQDGIQNP